MIISLVIGLAAFLLISWSDWQNRVPESPTVNNPDSIVAWVGSRSITLREVEQRVALPLYQADQQRYHLLQQTIQLVIDDELLRAEASRKGVSIPQLLHDASESEAVSRLLDPPTPGRQLTPIRRSVTDLQDEARVRQALLVSLRRKSDVRNLLPALEPPVLAVGIGHDHQLGPEGAPVTIVEFSDFQCPYCRQSVKVLKELRQVYGERIRLVYRDYPGPNHRYALQAAEAARCAGEQGKFWEYHDLLFDRQSAENGWDFHALAQELGMNQQQFAACLTSGRFRKDIGNSMRDALKLGMTSTPTFFINGRPLVGAQPQANLRALIDPLPTQAALQ
jgi:protein-disulfide isomerase